VPALVLALGCVAPDRPTRLEGGLPERTLLGGLAVAQERVAPGVKHFVVRSEEGPWTVHLLSADLRRCDLALDVLTAERGAPPRPGLRRVSDMAAREGARVLAAVNGDFFTPGGRPLGPEASGGRVRWPRSRPALAWSPDGGVWVGRTRVVGDSVLWAGAPLPHRAGGLLTRVVGGDPLLLVGGRRADEGAVRERPRFAAGRHPRTAAGFDRETGRAWLVVVDGRQGRYSDGMTLPELTALLEALGVDDAVNLDGGGSSVMVVRGRTVTHPSDPDGERPVVNALAVVRDASRCAAPVERLSP